MRRTYANVWSQAACGLTALSHTRAAVFRWGFVILLTIVWIGGGLYYWRDQGALEAVYRTFSAVGMWDEYFSVDDPMLQAVRFAAIATPAIGLLFAFSGQLGRSLARIFNLGAAHHVVIAGDSPAALSLALDCRRKKDAVILISQGLPHDTALDLRRRGVIVLEGDGAHIDTLRAARANHAAHVVAFEPDDTANLQIEAAVRRLVGSRKRRTPVGVHVATRSPLLLRESREMRSDQMRRRTADAPAPPIDPKPFSLDEIAARQLFQKEAQTLLSLAAQLGQPRVHVVFFGFDSAAEAFAERLLMCLWSARFEAPRLTVLAPDHEATEARFKTRHATAFGYPQLWTPDIAFLPFDWTHASVSPDLMQAVEAQRGKLTAAVVGTGGDPANIHLAIALRRVCNLNKAWPIPIYMKESAQSEFSAQYARGDETDELDAYLQAFGAHQITATRAKILDGLLDRGAAIAHEHYNQNLGAKNPLSLRELQAAMRDWPEVLETYRSANRAVADAAMVKIWDSGWRPARAGEEGDTAPFIPSEMVEPMARREHDRWNAERLLSGWRPAAVRDNALMTHDKLKHWGELTDEDRAKDTVQVRAALDIGRMLHPKGFVRL